MKTIFEKQKTFFNTGATKNIDFRITALKKLKSKLLEYEGAITEALYHDLRKSPQESFITELYPCLQEINLMLKHVRAWSKPQKHKTPFIFHPTKSFTQYEPQGAVLILAPWNYPVYLTIIPLIGAIAAGNCVVIKPSEHAPKTAHLLHTLITELYTAQHVACILGDEIVAQELVDTPSDYIFFTGSTHVGKRVMHAAAEHLTPVTLELGGKCPVIIDETANLKTAAQRVTWGKLLNAGQTCIAPDYILVHQAVKDAFFEALVHEFKKQHTKKYNRIINMHHFNRLKKLLEDSTLLYGGAHNEKELYIEPTIVEVTQEHQLLHQEIFGPILPLITYSTEHELIMQLQQQPSPLALYIFSENECFITAIQTHIPSGAIVRNDVVIQAGITELPFGGKGASGFGRYKGRASFETFSYQRTYTITPSGAWLAMRFNGLLQKIVQFFH